jgi:hypothetical protein
VQSNSIHKNNERIKFRRDTIRPTPLINCFFELGIKKRIRTPIKGRKRILIRIDGIRSLSFFFE